MIDNFRCIVETRNLRTNPDWSRTGKWSFSDRIAPGQTKSWKSRTGPDIDREKMKTRTNSEGSVQGPGGPCIPNSTYPICVKICCVPFLIVTWILSRSNLDSDIEIFWKWIKSFRFDLLQSNSVGGIALIVNRKRSKHFLIFSSISVVSYFVSRNLASDEPLRLETSAEPWFGKQSWGASMKRFDRDDF